MVQNTNANGHKLAKGQDECVDPKNFNGQYLVLAGPGTGKTHTIIQRIVAMKKNGIDLHKVLCLTFTEAAVGEMKKRTDAALKTIDSGVVISTYHSFCKNIIDEYPEEFDFGENIRVIPDSVKKEFLKECVYEYKPKGYWAETNKLFSCVSEIKKRIDEIKLNKYIASNKIDRKRFFYNLKNHADWVVEYKAKLAELKEKLQKPNPRTATLESEIKKLKIKIIKMVDLWFIYELYQKKTDEFNYIDFNDMINSILDKFNSDPSFREKISNQYDYIIVDEYQDTNALQNEIILKLAYCSKDDDISERKNIFVVGDDNQIIYTYQGASPDTVKNFLDVVPCDNVICLTDNWRSTKTILDISRQVIIEDPFSLEKKADFREKYGINKKLNSANKDLEPLNKPVLVQKYKDSTCEILGISNEIADLINSPNCPCDSKGNKKLSEIAILTRSNKELLSYSQALKNLGIPTELKDGKSIFEIRSSIAFYYYLSAVSNPERYSDRLYKLMLLTPFSINPKDYETISNKRSLFKTFFECLINIDEKDLVEPDKIIKFVGTYNYLKDYCAKESLKDTVLEVGKRTGFFDYYLNYSGDEEKINATDNIAGIKKIIDEAADFSAIKKTVTLVDFINYLDMVMEDSELSILTDKAPNPLNAVQLSTYHSSKGREFDYVFMPCMFNTKWENNSANKPQIPVDPKDAFDKTYWDEQKESDQRRLMYVAFTRARHTLILSYFENCGRNTRLSKYVEELLNNEKLRDEIITLSKIPNADSKEEENAQYWQKLKEYAVKRDYNYKAEFSSFIDNKLENKKFSPSLINKYLNCPRSFFYENILNLSPKSGSPDARSFGSAIHYSFERAINKAMEDNAHPKKDYVIKQFKEKLKSVPFSSFEERIFFLEKGIKTIDKYYHHITDIPVSDFWSTEQEINFAVEIEIKKENGAIEKRKVEFKGYIDRVDKIGDKEFVIYDYKTGRKKPDSQIAPNKKYEDYYNQMAFYKYAFEHLCFERDKNGKYVAKGLNEEPVNKVKETIFIFPEEPEKPYSLPLDDINCAEVKEKFLNAVKNILQDHNFEPLKMRNTCQEPCLYCAYKDYCSIDVL